MKKIIQLSLLLMFTGFCSHAKTLITSLSQVPGTLNIQVNWGETDVNLSDAKTTLNRYKLIYKMVGGSATTIDPISSSSRSYTISGLAVGTYEIELIEVIRIEVDPTPFSDPFVDTETSSGLRTVTINSLNAPPVAVCSNRTVAVGSGTWVNFTAQQAGEGSTDPNGDPLTYSINPEGSFTVGNHAIELTVTDPGGLSSKCFFTLTVVDNHPPVVHAKNAVIVMKANGFAELNIVDVDNGSFDAVSPIEMSLSKRLFTCQEVGFNSVTLHARDQNGNISSKSVTVQVLDHTEPYIIDKPISLLSDANGQAILSQEMVESLVYDNCGLSYVRASKNIFSLNNPFDSFSLFARDRSGNTSAKTISVRVLGSVPIAALAMLVDTTKIAQDSLTTIIPQDSLKGLSIRATNFLNTETLKQNGPLFSYGPNPVEDKLSIGLLRESLDLFTLMLRDANGNLIEFKKFHSKETSLDFSKLKKGTYYINVRSNSESETKRIELKR